MTSQASSLNHHWRQQVRFTTIDQPLRQTPLPPFPQATYNPQSDFTVSPRHLQKSVDPSLLLSEIHASCAEQQTSGAILVSGVP